MGAFFSKSLKRLRSSRSLSRRLSNPSRSLSENMDKKTSKKYAYISDQFTSLEQVQLALRESGLESSNLIVGIDFTKSNEWTGKHSNNGRSLHAIGESPNPYEQAISIIGQTLAAFDEDNQVPCFGFGDDSTHDQFVFSFYRDHRPCVGFEEALLRYRTIAPLLRLSGPTSFAPIVEAAMSIVEDSGGQYHILLIIADGQVTRSIDTEAGSVSLQEQSTINAIVAASEYALSIILVGVGDGPWDMMKEFDDKIPARRFDNFQFVNFTEIMAKNIPLPQKEALFALSALMEMPFQYKATLELNIIGHRIGGTRGTPPLPPPRSVLQADSATRTGTFQSGSLGSPHSRSIASSASSAPSRLDNEDLNCPVCLTQRKDMAFGCGHQTCRECAKVLSICPICRQRITTRIFLY